MTNPNQITACAAATRQGVYKGRVRMYDAEPGRFGLSYKEWYMGAKTRDRKVAMAAAREAINAVKGMTPDAARAYFDSVQTASLFAPPKLG